MSPVAGLILLLPSFEILEIDLIVYNKSGRRGSGRAGDTRGTK